MDWTRLTLPHDKANHLIWGFVVALVMTAAARWAGFAPWAPAIGMVAALVVGAMKELMDHMENLAADDMGAQRQHTVSLGDVVATACGGAVHWAALALGGGMAMSQQHSWTPHDVRPAVTMCAASDRCKHG